MTSRLYCAPEEFVLRLRQRMPMDVGFTFTDEQLAALSRAFGDRFDGTHAVDMRGRLYLPWTRYYLVFQVGRDRRHSAASQARRTAAHSFLCGLALSSAVVAAAWFTLQLVF
ncbi:MAG TPA: hypothetical protein VMB73_13810 [Acetobacteraceae bacterium]|nr:hypothetical protein [Acetobacteraceae bacterium]